MLQARVIIPEVLANVLVSALNNFLIRMVSVIICSCNILSREMNTSRATKASYRMLVVSNRSK